MKSRAINGYSICLNPVLLVQQEISSDLEDIILDTHVEKYLLVEEMTSILPNSNIDEYHLMLTKLGVEWNLRQYLWQRAEMIDALELFQQFLWGFSLREDMRQWYNVPHCTCGKIENNGYYGNGRNSDRRLVNTKCIIHSYGKDVWMPNIDCGKPDVQKIHAIIMNSDNFQLIPFDFRKEISHKLKVEMNYHLLGKPRTV